MSSTVGRPSTTSAQASASRARGISLHLLDLGGDVTGNGVSGMVFTILSAVAQFERERIGERIADVKKDQRSYGRYLGGRKPPFGFVVVPDYRADGSRKGGRLEPDPDQQQAIAQAVSLRAQGWSLRRIKVAFADMGHKISVQGLNDVLSRPDPHRLPGVPIEEEADG